MKERSTRYIIILAAIAAVLTTFTFFGLDPVINWIDFPKGDGFLVAFASLFVSAIVVIGLLIDLATLCVLRLTGREMA